MPENDAPETDMKSGSETEPRIAISDEIVDQLLAGYKKPEDLLGPGGLIKQLMGRLIGPAMNAELSHHLAYGNGEVPPENQNNRWRGEQGRGPQRRVNVWTRPRRQPSSPICYTSLTMNVLAYFVSLGDNTRTIANRDTGAPGIRAGFVRKSRQNAMESANEHLTTANQGDTKMRARINKTCLASGAVAFVVLGMTAGTASATPYSITTTSMADDPNDQICTFVEAIKAVQSANKSTGYNECAKNDGHLDVITLKAGIGDYVIPSQIYIDRSVSIKSGTANTLVTLAVDPNIFVDMQLIEIEVATTPALISFTDVALIGVEFGGISGFNGEDTLPAGGKDMLTLTQCLVTGFDAGGIVLNDISLKLQDSWIDENFNDAGGSGSGVFIESANTASTHLEMYNSSITRNAPFGGIYLELATKSVSTINNSTISDNNGSGVTIFNQTGATNTESLTITGSTIAFNSCDVSGTHDCGITTYSNGPSIPVVNLKGTVVGQNVAYDNSHSDFRGPIALLQDSLLETSAHATICNTCKKGKTSTDYGSTNLDSTLTDHGGKGQIHPWTHKPLHNSICVDFLPNSSNVLLGGSDQRYQKRGVDFPNRGGNQVWYDVGAIELKTSE